MADRVFKMTPWGGVQPPSGWQFGAGSFTGIGNADLFGYHPMNGSLWVGNNTGAGFSFLNWGSVSPAAGWKFVVGDLTGSEGADIVGYHPNTGGLWVGTNTGSSFQLQLWRNVQPASGWQFGTGFFTGGAKADLFAYHPSNGSLWVGRNTGTTFDFQLWGTVPATGTWQFVIGDFTGSGRPDVVGHDPSTGNLWLGENEGSNFLIKQYGQVQPTTGWQFGSGYFTLRGKADLFAYHPSNGSMWVSVDDGTKFTFEQWATTSPAAGWEFFPGLFTEDIWVDLIGYQPATGALQLWRSTERPVEGYCWPLSVAPGQKISFMTSGGGQSSATIRKYTSTSATVESVNLKQVNFNSPIQPTAASPWATGCGWNETFSFNIPSSWKSGIYAAACVDADGSTTDITFLVRPKPAQRSQVALLANVNTWLAYNGWGGFSKYSGLARTSFMRPMQNAAPNSDMHLTRGELWIQSWLETEGYRPDMYTDVDFHENGCDASQYKLLISGTHPEYWTTQMYDNLVAYLNAGGSFAYLGGNGLFEVCAWDPQHREMVFREGIEGGPRVPGLFRVRQPLRPERSVVGVATERCAVVGSPYQVLNANHFLFDGTGVANGQQFGNVGLNTGFGNGKASAWEVDTASGLGATSIPYDCVIDEPAVVPPSQLPAGLTIIANGVPEGTKPGADIIYYDHAGGGFVFSVGSITFGGSLVVDGILQALMHNVLAKAEVAPV